MLFEYDLINEVTDGLPTRHITEQLPTRHITAQTRGNRAPPFIHLFMCLYGVREEFYLEIVRRWQAEMVESLFWCVL